MAEPLVQTLRSSDIALLGEIHDNPIHHERQALAVDAMQPKALVFEMLTEGQAQAAQASLRTEAALRAATGWDDSGWPDFAMYWPIFDAAPQAMIFGAAVPREKVRSAFGAGAVALFAGDAAEYGLDQPLPEDEQAERMQAQFEAHCEAMPLEMMGGMVEVQRLRDAELARVALLALAQTGGPVAVILGSGHARSDWGVPVYLARVAPEVKVMSLGQTEGDSGARFDAVLSAPAPARGDPCEAFK